MEIRIRTLIIVPAYFFIYQSELNTLIAHVDYGCQWIQKNYMSATLKKITKKTFY